MAHPVSAYMVVTPPPPGSLYGCRTQTTHASEPRRTTVVDTPYRGGALC